MGNTPHAEFLLSVGRHFAKPFEFQKSHRPIRRDEKKVWPACLYPHALHDRTFARVRRLPANVTPLPIRQAVILEQLRDLRVQLALARPDSRRAAGTHLAAGGELEKGGGCGHHGGAALGIQLVLATPFLEIKPAWRSKGRQWYSQSARSSTNPTKHSYPASNNPHNKNLGNARTNKGFETTFQHRKDKDQGALHQLHTFSGLRFGLKYWICIPFARSFASPGFKTKVLI